MLQKADVSLQIYVLLVGKFVFVALDKCTCAEVLV